jgi:hypothetical protein
MDAPETEGQIPSTKNATGETATESSARQDMLPSDEVVTTSDRRRFLKWFGVSASGVALANTLDTSKEKIEAGGERAQEEIAKLRKAYQELDDRSQLILKLILILSGLDFITAL